MEITGTIKSIGETQFIGKLTKCELILQTDEQYPQMLSIEFLNASVNLLDNYAGGENVKVGINLRGREWVNPQGETKYFNSIQGWKIENV